MNCRVRLKENVNLCDQSEGILRMKMLHASSGNRSGKLTIMNWDEMHLREVSTDFVQKQNRKD